MRLEKRMIMLEKLVDLVAKYTSQEKSVICKESVLTEDLGLNSYEFMCLLEDIEDELGVYITDIEAEEIKTVGDILGFIENKS